MLTTFNEPYTQIILSFPFDVLDIINLTLERVGVSNGWAILIS